MYIYTLLPGIGICSACMDCSFFFLAGTNINADDTCNTKKKNNYITVTQFLSVVVLNVNVQYYCISLF